MSEREVQEAAVVCPFVAFDDDRDHRSDRPDHRHRCFAEVRPATRAAAHQEAYCLSLRFATCPTFMDWATREAARVRPSGATRPRGSAAVGGAAAVAGAASLASEPPSQGEPEMEPPREWSPNRPADREWASPPPWVGSSDGAPDVADGQMSTEADEPALPSDTAEPPAFVAAVPPRTREPSSAPPDRSSDHGAGRPTGEPPPSSWQGSWEEPGDDLDVEEPAGPPRRFGPAGGRSRERIPVDPDAPTWERPRRFEAYPTLRTRTGLRIPGGSPLILAAIGIFALAIALFFVPSMLLGLGGGEAGATPTPSASAEASPSAAPTPTPAPTPQTYVVQSGDTMSAIAARFGVSLDALIEANSETVPNPNQVQVGQTLVIPTAPPAEIPGASSEPSPSP